MQKEQWKPVVGFEGLYEISSLGRVKSLNRKAKIWGGNIRTVNERILKPGLGSHGYLTVNLSRNGKFKVCTIHRLVARAFLKEFSEELEADHIDGDRMDNSSENLRMVTPSQNHKGFRKQCESNTSHYRGVCFDKSRGKWISSIKPNGKHIFLGRFEREISAAVAYNIAAEKYGYQKEALNKI